MSDDVAQDLTAVGTPVRTIPVHISYEIIRLFSEGLYQSPHKAIEELVSNGYDAGATAVHVLTPQPVDDADDGTNEEATSQVDVAPTAPLWVIDNGSGMNVGEFEELWHVAHSNKATYEPESGQRAPIGQFGIGKLAAYVLAWRLTHISKSGGEYHFTSMNFHLLEELHQDDTEPFKLALRGISEDEAKVLLADVEERDPEAWHFLFGDEASDAWTAAGLDDFKALYDRLRGGRLSWVLRTGLPLHTDFSIWLNGDKLESSKLDRATIKEVVVGGDADSVAPKMELEHGPDGVVIPGIDGTIHGSATIYKDRITEGKSDQYGRSNGFFIRVRERVINLEDELFGLDVLNHAAWSRFSMEVHADGLRDHLLSSREGVRESAAITVLRRYLLGIFNLCRQAFDEWTVRQEEGLDVEQLLRDAPSVYVTEPLQTAVAGVVNTGQESFYIDEPDLDEGVTPGEFLDEYSQQTSSAPFSRVIFEGTGRYDRALRYRPDTRTIIINTDHPFINKMLAGGKSKGHVTLFSSAEVFIDALLQEHGVPQASVFAVLEDRDRVLRLLAGDQPSTAAEVLGLLDAAVRNSTALERVIGPAFKVLGLEYERLGGSEEGPDGLLFARLGRGGKKLADYKLVYDSKQTDAAAVPADKVKVDSLEDFRRSQNADYGFFFAKHYAAEMDLDKKLNREVAAAVGRSDNPARVTLLRVEDLKRIVTLHYKYGITLTRLRSLFETAHTVPEVVQWVDDLEAEVTTLEPTVPLQRLLDKLEEAKGDTKAIPNVNAVRVLDPEVLTQFEPEKLIAALQAVQTIIGDRWIEVENSGEVRLHHTANQIVAEVERGLRSLFGVDPREPDHPDQ